MTARLPEPAGQRASDADRQRVVELLREHVSRGALSIDEFEERLGLALQARTIAELAAVTWDLDVGAPAGRRKRGIWRNIGFRYHAAAYGLSNGFLIGTWAVTTPDALFWPFFPAAGWGIGLGLHAMAAHHKEERRLEREERRMLSSSRNVALPPASSPVAARRFVAVLFTDIANSTKLTEALGDAEWSVVRARHRALLRECFSSHRGSEVGSQGDGFLARFATPIDAVRCAVEVQRRLGEQRDSLGFAPVLRIGVHAGEAVEDRDDLVGSVINVAARVMAEAEPGEILVTEPVADQIDGHFETEDRGLRSLRGVGKPRHLLAIRWAD